MGTTQGISLPFDEDSHHNKDCPTMEPLGASLCKLFESRPARDASCRAARWHRTSLSFWSIAQHHS